MAPPVARGKYFQALNEEPGTGIALAVRPAPSLEEARTELAQSLSRFTKSILRDQYGPLINVISEPALTEVLKNFESKLVRSKGDFTILLEEILDRMIPSSLNRKSEER
jgi:hypothetical protein